MTNSSMPPFHLAFPVTDLEATRVFFTQILGCTQGRTSARWLDFDFFGHQLTAHLVDDIPEVATNPVDGDKVPARHFGAILDMDSWKALADRLEQAGTRFLIAPHIRFAGEAGEQATMFFYDPSGNALEFKAFANSDQIFAK